MTRICSFNTRQTRVWYQPSRLLGRFNSVMKVRKAEIMNPKWISTMERCIEEYKDRGPTRISKPQVQTVWYGNEIRKRGWTRLGGSLHKHDVWNNHQHSHYSQPEHTLVDVNLLRAWAVRGKEFLSGAVVWIPTVRRQETKSSQSLYVSGNTLDRATIGREYGLDPKKSPVSVIQLWKRRKERNVVLQNAGLQ